MLLISENERKTLKILRATALTTLPFLRAINARRNCHCSSVSDLYPVESSRQRILEALLRAARSFVDI